MVSIVKYGQEIDLSKIVAVNGKKSLTLDNLVLNNTIKIKIPAGTKYVSELVEDDLKIEFTDAEGNILELILKDMTALLAQNDGFTLVEMTSVLPNGIESIVGSVTDLASATQAAAAGPGQQNTPTNTNSDSSTTPDDVEDEAEEENNNENAGIANAVVEEESEEATQAGDNNEDDVQNLPNDAPVITPIATQTVDEDNVKTITFTATDAENDTLNSSVTATNGTAIINTNGDIEFTPNTNYNGPATVTLTVDDGNGGTTTQVINVTVNPVNDAPVITPIATQTVDEDNVKTITFTATDVDGDTLNSSVTATNGTAIINTNGDIEFTPNTNYNGPATVTLTVDDGNGEIVSQVIYVTVNPVNDAPVITPIATQTVDEDNVKTITFTATDVDGDTLNSSVTATNGTAIINTNGDIEFTPNTNYNGPATVTLTVDDGNGGTTTQVINVTVNPVNDAPVITPIATQTVDEDNVKTITFTATDVDGDTLNSSVTATNGTAIINTNGDIEFTPNTNYNGPATVTLTVDDGNGEIVSQVIYVTVNPVNDAPVITPIATQTVDEDNVKTITFTATDVDGDTLNSSVTATNGTAIINTNGDIEFTPTADFNGDATVTLTVVDGNGGTTTQVINVTVNPVNDAPVITPIATQTVDEDNVKTITFTATDVDGDTLNSSVTATNGTAIINTNGDIEFTPTADFNGDATVTLTVVDGNGGTTTQVINVTVNPVNDAPVITPIATQTVDEDNVKTITFTATDVDGDTLNSSVTATNGTAIINTNGDIEFTPTADFNGDATVTLTVVDGNGGTTTQVINVTVNPVNDAPVITPIATQTVDEDNVKTITFTATDVDGDTLNSSVTATNGTAIINTNGDIEFTPTADFNGDATVTLTVVDGNGGTTTQVINVTVNPVNDAPVITPIATQTVDEDNVKTITFTATDAENDTLNSSVTATNGTAIINTNGDIEFTPNTNYNGPATVTLTVDDGNGEIVSQVIYVTVNPVNDAPVITPIATQTVDEDNVKTITFTAADIDGDILTSSAVAGNGTATISGNVITYTPNADYNGTDTITLSVNDGSITTTQTFDVTVTPVNDAPTIEIIATQTVDEDNVKTITFTAADIDGDILTSSAVAGNGTATISGNVITYTPNADYNGTDTITLSVNDGSITTTQTFDVTVTPVNDAPTIEIIATQTVDEDNVKTITFTAADIDGDILTSSAVAGNGTATISGNVITYTPNADYNGTDTITLSVNDGSTTTTQTFDVTVTPVNDAPTIEIIATQTVDEDNVKTITFTAADIDGDILTSSAVAGNGTATISGNVITYTPNADYNGTDTITLSVNDGSTTTTQTFDVTVTPVNDAPTIEIIATQTVDEDNVKTITFTAADIDGDILTSSAVAGNGTATISGNVITYTPNADYNGTDTITLSVNDGSTTTTQTFDVTVTPVNDAPTIETIATQTVDEDNVKTITFTAADIDGDILTSSAVAGNGTATISGNVITYTPNADYNGTDTITLSVNDGSITTTQTINVTVNPVNDAPYITELTVIEIPESELDEATDSQLATFTVEDNGNISYERTVTINTDLGVDINDIISQFNNALVSLLPGATTENINISSVETIPNTYTISALIGDLPDNAAQTVLNNSFITTIFNNILPAKNSIYTGTISGVTDVDSSDSYTIDVKEINLSLTSSNSILISLLDTVTEIRQNSGDIKNILIDTLKNGLEEGSVETKTINLPSSATKLLITAGLLYVDVDSSTGDYTIYSPLFNMIKPAEKINIGIEFDVIDGNGEKATNSYTDANPGEPASTLLVSIMGTNDQPVAVDGSDTVSMNSEEVFEGSLPGAYTKNMANTIFNTINSGSDTSIDTIINKDDIITSVKNDLLSNIDVSVDPDSLAQLQADLLPDLLEELDLTNAQILGALTDITNPIYAVVNPLLLTYQNLASDIQTVIESNLGDLSESNETALEEAINTFISTITNALFSQDSIDDNVPILKSSVQAIYANELSANIQIAISDIDSVQIATDNFIMVFEALSSNAFTVIPPSLVPVPLAGLSFTLTDTPALQLAISTFIDSNQTDIDKQSLVTALTTNNSNIGLLFSADLANTTTVVETAVTTSALNAQSALILEFTSEINTAIESVLGTVPIDFDLDATTSLFVASYLAAGDVIADQSDALSNFQTSVLNGYLDSKITIIEGSISDDFTTFSSSITNFQTDLADAIESGLGIVQPEFSLDFTLEEYNQYLADKDRYDIARDDLLADIIALVGQFNDSSFDFGTAAQDLIMTTISNYDLNINDVVINALPEDLVDAINAFKSSLSIDTSLVLDQLNLNDILLELGIDLEFDTQTIIDDMIAAVTAYSQTMSFSNLESVDGIKLIVDGFLETIITVIDSTFASIVDVSDQDLIDAIVSEVTDIVIAQITPNINSLGAELDSTFGLSGNIYEEIFGDIVSDVVTDLTSGIELHVEDIKDSTLNNLFDQLSLDKGLLVPETRVEISSDIVDDLLIRINMDEDGIDIATISYFIDENTAPTVVFLDENSNAITSTVVGKDGTSLDLSLIASEIIDSGITVDINGSYTITHDEIDNIPTQFDLQVIFDYFISDQNNFDGTDGINENSNSESKTMSITINFEDTVTNVTLLDGYIANATVFADANKDGVWQFGEVKTVTDVNGDFTLVGGTGPLVASGGIDISTGLAFEGILTAPEGSSVVTPLTALIDQVQRLNDGMDTAVAANLVASNLGLSDITGEELLSYDPIEVSSDTNSTLEEKSIALEVQSISVQIMNIMNQTSQVINYETNEEVSEQVASTEVLRVLASDIEENSTLNLEDTNTLNEIVTILEDRYTIAIEDKLDVVESIININSAIASSESIDEIAQVQVVAENIENDIEDDGNIGTVLSQEDVETQAENVLLGDILSTPSIEENNLEDINGLDTTYTGILNPIIVEGLTESEYLIDGDISILYNGNVASQDILDNISLTINENGTYSIVSSEFNEMLDSDSFEITFNYTNGTSASATTVLTIFGNDDQFMMDEESSTSLVIEDSSIISNTVVASDSDTDIFVTYSATALAGFTLDEFSGVYEFDASNEAYQYLALDEILDVATTITATNQFGEEVTKVLTFNITGTNDAPSVIALEALDTTLTILTGSVTASDIDTNDTLTYSSPEIAGFTINSETGDYSFNPTVEAYANLAEGESLNITIPISVNDGNGSTVSTNLVIAMTGINDIPTVESISSMSIDEDGGLLTGSIIANDVDNDSFLSYSADSIDGLFVDSETGIYSFNPSHESYQSLNVGQILDITINFIISDEHGEEVSVDLEIQLTGTNDSPTIALIDTISVIEDSEIISQTLLVSDADENATFTFTAAPTAGFAIDLNSGVYSFDPTVEEYQSLGETQSLTVTIPVTVTDQYNASTTTNIIINLEGSNDAPTVGTINEIDVTSSIVTGILPVSDVDNNTVLTYTAAPTAGFTLNEENGEYSFNPTVEEYNYIAEGDTETLIIPVTVTDEFGDKVDFDLTVNITGSNYAPIISSIEAISASEGGNEVTGIIEANDVNENSVLTYSSSPETAGFTLNPQTGSYFFDPVNSNYDYLYEGQALSIDIPITVRDEEGASSNSTLTVNIIGTNDSPVLDSITQVSASENTISGTIIASDVDTNSDLTFTVSETSGFTIDSTSGAYSFDPTIADYAYLNVGDVEIITIPVTVTDEHGLSATTNLEIELTGTNSAPIISAIDAVDAIEGGDSITGTIEVNDLDFNSVFTYTIDGTFEGFEIDDIKNEFTFDPTDTAYNYLAQGDILTLTIPVTVSDNTGLSSSTDIIINLTGTNDTPTVEAISQLSASTETITGTIIASDIDTDSSLSYSHSDTFGFTLNDETGAYSFDPTNEAYNYLAEGQIEVIYTTVTVRDEHDLSAETVLSIEITGTNTSPTVSSIEAVTIDEDSGLVTGDIAAIDVDTNSTLTYSSATVAGFIIDQDTGSYSFDPSNEAYQYLALGDTTTVIIPVTVTDEYEASSTTNIEVNLRGTNDTPYALSTSAFHGTLINTDIQSFQDLVADINSEDKDATDTVSYSIVANESDDSQYLTIDSDGLVTFIDENAYDSISDPSSLNFQVEVSDNNNASSIYTIQSGQGIDGYIVNMTVFSDTNNDLVLNNSEASTETNSLGEFTIGGPDLSGNLIGIGGTDVSTGLDFEGIYKAPSGSSILNPSTTLIVNLMEEGNLDLLGAKNSLKTAFGLDNLVEPISDAIESGNIPLQVVNVLIENTVSQIAAMMDGLDLASEQEASNTVSIEIANIILSEGTIDLSNSSTISTLISNTLSSFDSSIDSSILSDLTTIVTTINSDIKEVSLQSDYEIAFETLVKIQVAAEETEQEIEDGLESEDLSTALNNITSGVFNTRVQNAETGTITQADIETVQSIDEDEIFTQTYYIGESISEFNGVSTFPTTQQITLTFNAEDNEKIEVDVNITVNQNGTYTFSSITGEDIDALSSGESARASFDYVKSGESATSKFFLEVNGENDAPITTEVNPNYELVNREEFTINPYNSTGTSQSNINNLFENGSGSVTLSTLTSQLNAEQRAGLNISFSDGAAVKYTIEANAGETISFDWVFTDREYNSSYYNDFSFVVVDGESIDLLAMVSQSGLVNNDTFTFTTTETRAYEFTFGTMNDQDRIVDSSLQVVYVDGGDLTNTETVGTVTSRTTTVEIENNPSLPENIEDTVNEDFTFSGVLEASDVDVNDTLTFSIVGDVPAGLTIESTGDFYLDTSVLEYQYLTQGQELVISFDWIAQDSEGLFSSTQTQYIKIIGANDAPIVSEIIPLTAFENGGIYTSTVQAIDLDEDASTSLITYTLTGDIPSGLTLNIDGSYSFDAANSQYNYLSSGEGAFVEFNWIATDAHGASSEVQTQSITLIGTNDIPVISIITPVETTEDSVLVTGSVQASDADISDSLTYTSIEIDGFILNYETGEYSFDPSHEAYQSLSVGQQSALNIPITVTDSNGASTSSNLVINITGANDVPTVSAQNISASNIVTGEIERTTDGYYTNSIDYWHFTHNGGELTVDILTELAYYNSTYTDINGNGTQDRLDSYIYLYEDSGSYNSSSYVASNDDNWSSVSRTDGSSHGYDSFLSLSSLEEGNYVLVIGSYHLSQGEIEQGYNNSSYDGPYQITFTGDISLSQTPQGNYSTTVETLEDTVYNGQVLASDVDGNDTLTYALVGNIPVGLTMSSNGSYSFDTSDDSYNSLANGEELEVTFTWIATDSQNAQSAVQTQIITVVGINNAPVIQEVLAADVSSSLYTNSINVSDLDGDALSFASSTVAGFIINPQTGVYSFDPEDPAYQYLVQGQTTSILVPVTVTDENGLSSTTDVVFNITGTNNTPSVGLVNEINVLEDGAIVQGSIIATDSDSVSSLTYTSSSIDGFTINSSTGEYSFDPSHESYQSLAEGETTTVTIPVTVRDEYGASDSTTIAINVTGVNDIPTASTQNIELANSNVVTGELVRTGNTNNIDYWHFTHTGGSLEIDVLTERSNYYNSGVYNDIDGNGSQNIIDSYIYLYEDTGSYNSSSYVTRNDDSSSGRADGTLHSYDSYLNLSNLDSGNYVLVISSYYLSQSEIQQGYQYDNDQGPYQITFTGNIAITESPAGATSIVNTITENTIYQGQVQANDVDGDSLTYALVGTLPAGLIFDTNGSYSFDGTHEDYQYLSNSETLNLEFTWVAIDSNNAQSEVQTQQITLIGTNGTPVIESVQNLDAVEDGVIVSGQITASDVDSSLLTYTTTSNIAGFTLNSSTGQYSFDPSNEAYQSLALGEVSTITVPVSVSDDEGASSSSNIVITVTGSNDAPVATSSSSIIDSNVVTGSIESIEGTSNNTIDYISFAHAGGALSIDVLTEYGSSSNYVDVNQNGVQNPLDSYIYLYSDTGTFNSSSYVSSNDDNGNSADGSVHGYDSYLSFSNLAAGSYVLAIGAYHLSSSEVAQGYNVNNSYEGPYQVTFSGNVTVSEVSQSASVSVSQVTEGSSLNGQVLASDIDGDSITYSLVGNAIEGLSFNANGTFTYDALSQRFASLSVGETQTVTFSWLATDSNGATSEVQSTDILVTGTNTAPILSVDSAVVENEDGTRTINFTASDIDGTVTTTASVNEAQGSVQVVNGQIIFTPADEFEGTANITITTTDNDNESLSQNIAVEITLPNETPYVENDVNYEETQVNTYTSSNQRTPAITSLEDGGYVITWSSYGQDGSHYGVYSQRYDSNSQAVGEETQVNTYTNSYQQTPAITSLEDGGYVITWSSYGQDGSHYGVYSQRYDSNSQAVGEETQVNTYTSSSQYSPAITSLEDGGYVITWSSYGQDGSSYGVYSQRYDSNSQAVGEETQVNTYTSLYQFLPAITSLEDGGYVITWSSYGQDGSSYGVYSQRYDSNSQAVGEETQVNTYTNSYQQTPAITSLEDGGYVITWVSNGQDGSFNGVYSQRYDSNSQAVGEETQVNTYTSSNQRTPAITSLEDGGYVITWSSYGQDGSHYGVYSQRYDSNSQAVGEETQVNTYTNSYQQTPAITSLEDGGYVITWSSYGQDGSSDGVYSQRYDSNGNTVSSLVEVTTQEDTIFTSEVEAMDPNDDVLTYSLVDEAPAGLTFNENGSYSLDTSVEAYQALEEGETQTVSFSWIATDPEGLSTGTQTVNITVEGSREGNNIPIAYETTQTIEVNNTINGHLPGAMIGEIQSLSDSDFDVYSEGGYYTADEVSLSISANISEEEIATATSSMNNALLLELGYIEIDSDSGEYVLGDAFMDDSNPVYQAIFDILDPIEDTIRDLNDYILADLYQEFGASNDATSLNNDVLDYLTAVKLATFSSNGILGENLTTLLNNVVDAYNPENEDEFRETFTEEITPNIDTLLTSVATSIFSIQAPMVDAIESALGIVEPAHSFGETLEEYTIIEAAIEIYEEGHDVLNASIVSVARAIVDPDIDKSGIATDVLVLAIEGFNLDTEALIESNIPDVITSLTNDFIASLSELTVPDSQLNAILVSLGSTVHTDITGFKNTLQSELEVLVNEIPANATENSISDSIYELTNSVVNNYASTITAASSLNIGQLESIIESTPISFDSQVDTLIAQLNSYLSSQIVEGDAIIALASSEFRTMIEDALNSLNISIDANASLINENISQYPLSSLLVNTPLGDLTNESIVDEFADDLAEDLIVRSTIDEDFFDVIGLTYILDENVQPSLSITDDSGEVSTFGLTNFTLNENGTYTLGHEGFDSETFDSAQLTFDYTVYDGTDNSESKTAVINIDNEVDTFIPETTEIDMAALLSSPVVGELDTIDLSSGDHILNNLSLEDFISLTDDDNTLKIFGDLEDSISLNSEDEWEQVFERDEQGNNTDIALKDSGNFNVYTSASNESIRLLIEDNVNVEII